MPTPLPVVLNALQGYEATRSYLMARGHASDSEEVRAAWREALDEARLSDADVDYAELRTAAGDPNDRAFDAQAAARNLVQQQSRLEPPPTPKPAPMPSPTSLSSPHDAQANFLNIVASGEDYDDYDDDDDDPEGDDNEDGDYDDDPQQQRYREFLADFEREGGLDTAVQLYAMERKSLWDGGIPLDGPDNEKVRLRLLERAGLDPEDFSLSGWKAATAESDTLPGNPGSSGVINLTNQLKNVEHTRRNRRIQEELTVSRASFDGDRDGLPRGQYEYDEESGEFRRVGPIGELYRYHGTVVPPGTLIDEFRPSPGNPDSTNRPSIGVTPAVYTTEDANAALEYAEGYNNFVSGASEGQLYTVEITPDEVVSLGECQDDEAANRAIRAGFDVIECPDFWEQPETIAFETEKVRPLEMHRVGERGYDDEEDFEDSGDRGYGGSDDSVINDLIEEGRLEDPVPVPRKQRMDAVKAAITEYRENGGGDPGGVNGASSVGLAKSMEYRGVPKESAYRPRRGRGSMKY